MDIGESVDIDSRLVDINNKLVDSHAVDINGQVDINSKLVDIHHTDEQSVSLNSHSVDLQATDLREATHWFKFVYIYRRLALIGLNSSTFTDALLPLV